MTGKVRPRSSLEAWVFLVEAVKDLGREVLWALPGPLRRLILRDNQDTTAVELTADELLLLRQRLAYDGPGTPAVNSALDAKLYQAQRRLPPFRC